MCGKYCTERIRFTIGSAHFVLEGSCHICLFVCFLLLLFFLIFEGVAGSY